MQSIIRHNNTIDIKIIEFLIENTTNNRSEHNRIQFLYCGNIFLVY